MVLPVSGCSIKMVSYSPSILMEGAGNVSVGEFHYLPSDGGKLEINQVDTGMGLNPIYSEIAIKDYVSDAVKKELKFIGYKVDARSPIVISGDIAEYSCDYVGLTTVDIKTRIEWKLSRKGGKKRGRESLLRIIITADASESSCSTGATCLNILARHTEFSQAGGWILALAWPSCLNKDSDPFFCLFLSCKARTITLMGVGHRKSVYEELTARFRKQN